MKELRESFGGKCKRCGRSEPLEFAHIKPTKLSGANGGSRGRGMPQRYHDIKRNPECYELLCPLCHSKIDDFRRLPAEKEEVPF